MYLYCPKGERRLNVAVCEARGCGHLRKIEVEALCKFSPKREKMVKKRRKKKEEEDDCRADLKSSWI